VKSAEFFKLDHTHSPDLTLLANILAEIVFGERARGRKRGDKPTWTNQRLLELGFKYHDLKSKQPPGASDTDLAELISQEAEFREYKNSDTIRKVLGKARQEYKLWQEFRDEEAFYDSQLESRPEEDPRDSDDDHDDDPYDG
jgi:hypothetical protein